MMAANTFDAMFSGVIGREYQLLKLICPSATEMSRLVGVEVGEYCRLKSNPQSIVELGGGTGITTLSILSADERSLVLSVDNEPAMQNQAKQSLETWVDSGRLAFSSDDALSALKQLEGDSVDIVASAYTLHNFETGYRRQVINEIFRVLKSGGQFINGDRYALDEISVHTRNTQKEVAGYFKVLTEIDRLDLLEQWVIHLFNDESENHIMRESIALQQMIEAGFERIQFKLRHEVNALLTATK
ncbi:MAG: class I SAM-dependent methyltransferase [Methylomonas sp.]|jgi:ubiquinone/menaquinone biosynthesis C-methylase UbiE|uniref:class I SAM-dependent methyltransferase n=1 Tax=Methylomonas sp. TaxID=418 RepID=UPI0025F12DF7|nr:class I SAM-dependent methyltransferase [Methylomonas sp.]MCK9605339.1 class I SAM-dependent methyltransferase [Methylomonas sp.]